MDNRRADGPAAPVMGTVLPCNLPRIPLQSTPGRIALFPFGSAVRGGCYAEYGRRNGRVVEGGGLENRKARQGLGGSNPSSSAMNII